MSSKKKKKIYENGELSVVLTSEYAWFCYVLPAQGCFNEEVKWTI